MYGKDQAFCDTFLACRIVLEFLINLLGALRVPTVGMAAIFDRLGLVVQEAPDLFQVSCRVPPSCALSGWRHGFVLVDQPCNSFDDRVSTSIGKSQIPARAAQTLTSNAHTLT